MRRVALSLFFLAHLAIRSTSFAAGAVPPSEPEDSSGLQPYILCDGFAGGVRGVTLDRRPPSADPWREVSSGGMTRRVSVVEGYRVMYSYPRTYPFASLKVERSDLSKYGEDKQVVMGSLAELARADDNAGLVEFSTQGFSGQTVTKRQLGGSTLGITQIFSDEDAVIVTVFFLNHAPQNRRFQTYEEFISLRDDFVRGYLECVARKRSAAVHFRPRRRWRASPAAPRRAGARRSAASPPRPCPARGSPPGSRRSRGSAAAP